MRDRDWIFSGSSTCAGELVAKLRAKGEVVPDRIWLHGIGSDGGDVTWSNEPDPSGEPEEAEWAVEYALAATNAGQVEADPYVQQSRADLAASIAKLPSDFPNYGDWPITLPAGHWRALAALSQAKEPGK